MKATKNFSEDLPGEALFGISPDHSPSTTHCVKKPPIISTPFFKLLAFAFLIILYAQASFALSIGANNTHACVDDKVTLESIDGKPYWDYLWDFGDGATGSGPMVTHTYHKPGTYTITLKVQIPGEKNTIGDQFEITILPCDEVLGHPQDNWFFGKFGGLEFSGGFGQPNPDAWTNSSIDQKEGCITQNDPNGNLLFFSDGIWVWDANHQLINIGNRLNGHFSTSQSAFSVPDPRQSGRFFLFSLPAEPNEPPDPNVNTWPTYTMVNTVGGVTLSNINTPLPLPAGATRISEGINGVPRPDCGYWIIVKGSPEDPFPHSHSLFVYTLDEEGLNLHATHQVATPGYNNQGSIKFSPDGKKMAVSKRNDPFFDWDTEVFDFDYLTATFSNRRLLVDGGYGLSFSPDSRLLYVTTHRLLGMGHGVLQFDLAVPNLQSSQRIVYFDNAGYLGTMQIAPDNRIYVAKFNFFGLAYIGKPNIRVSGDFTNECNFVMAGIGLNTLPGQQSRSMFGLPNMMDAYRVVKNNPNNCYCLSFPDFDATPVPGTCEYQFTDQTFTESFAFVGYYGWDFGDGITTGSETQADANHLYAQPGVYEVCHWTATYNPPDQKCIDRICKQITVNCVPEACDLDAEFTVTNIDPNTCEVTFDASASTGGFNRMLWDFGDGTGLAQSSSPVFTRRYWASGDYDVTLYLERYGNGMVYCQDTHMELVQLNCVGGLHKREQTIDGAPHRLTVQPNPFRDVITLGFTLKNDDKVHAAVLDLTGRTVAVLAGKTFEAGSHTLQWQPQPDQQPGMYFIRYRDSQSQRMLKVIKNH